MDPTVQSTISKKTFFYYNTFNFEYTSNQKIRITNADTTHIRIEHILVLMITLQVHF